MASVSPASTSGFSEANPPSLKAGLAALKQDRTKIAIAHLEGIIRESPRRAELLQAQIGLAIAYDKIGDSTRAISLCEELKVSENVKAKHWATRTLASWAKRSHQSLAKPDTKPSGFVPLDEEPASAAKSTGFISLDEEPKSPSSTKSSGFVPLDEEPASAAKSTGFIPLDEEPKSPSSTKSSGFIPLDEEPASAAKSTGFIPLDEEPKSPSSTKSSGFIPLDEEPASAAKSSGFIPLDEKSSIDSSNPPTENLPSEGKIRENRSSREKVPEKMAIPSEPKTEPSQTAQTDDSDTTSPSNSSTLAQTQSLHQWRNRGRAKNWKRLKTPPISQLYWMQGVSTIALLWLANLLLHGFMYVTNEILVSVPFTRPIQAFYYDRTFMLVVVLAIVAIASPWLLDSILRLGFGLKPLTTSKLNRYSPETYQSLGRVCRQKHIPFPTLGILPETTPAIFTYGNWPKTARIVVTQGLLDRLEDDEIAALYVAELARIVHWDFVPISFGVALTQIFYLLYSQTARVGDWFYGKSREAEKQNPFLGYVFLGGTWIFAGWSAIGYGLSRLLRLPWLVLSRMRVSYSDRAAVAIVGNPNGLVRALFKMTVGVADTVRERGQTSEFLESFDLLIPVSPTAALSIGSLYPTLSPESLLAWDLENPHRPWLILNNSHPTLGERIAWLTGCAKFWKLEPELELPETSPKSQQKSKQKNRSLLGKPIVQGAPFFGMAIGFSVGCVLTLVGWLGESFDSQILAWLFDDRIWIISGLTMAGFSLGTLARINGFFPDMKPYALSVEPNFPEWLSNPMALPIDSKTIQCQGKLLGRSGVANWLGQDLILEVDRVLVKLHYCSKFGAVGNFLPQPVRPAYWIGRQVTITGWLRRGATSWIDLDTLAVTKKISTLPSGHPIWSSLLTGITALWGAYLLSGGGV